MAHRRDKHNINECKKYMEGTCRYNENSCWFKHTAKNSAQNQDFHTVSQQIKQPIDILLEQNQQMISTMLEMISQMKTVMSQNM